MIVVGVDFSEGAAAAVSLARDLSARRAESLHMVHVVSGTADADRLDPTSRAWLDGLSIQAADVEIRRGTPWVELVRAGEERGAAFLVTGTHGRSGFQSLRLGSTASTVALRSRTPVVLVPPERVSIPVAGLSRSSSNRSSEE